MTPYIVYLIATHDYPAALAWFCGAAATDVLDGWVARNFKGQSSLLGTALDPFADKFLMGSMTVALTMAGAIPLPLAAIILSRDILLIAFSFRIRYQTLLPLHPKITLRTFFDLEQPTVQVRPTLISKVNTVFQVGVVFSAMASLTYPDMLNAGLVEALWYATFITTAASGLSYILSPDAVKILSKLPRKKSNSTPASNSSNGGSANSGSKKS